MGKQDSGWLGLRVKCSVVNLSTDQEIEIFTCDKTDEALDRCKLKYGERYWETHKSVISVLR